MQVLATIHLMCGVVCWQQGILLGRAQFGREGSIWTVGDGRNIEVSTHKWLSHKLVFLGEPRQNLLVSDLMEANTWQWDREIFFDLFAFRTRMEIMAIPLPRTATRDTLVWKENRNKTFTVKSAYQVALRMKEQALVEHSTAALDRPIWNKIWALNVLPNVRTFLWRACSNILPTRGNLQRRKL